MILNSGVVLSTGNHGIYVNGGSSLSIGNTTYTSSENLYLNQKDAFSFDYLFGCIQDFTYIQDIYKKTDNIYNEGMFNYLVVSGCKEKDKKFFMEYENECISVLMFEEE